MKEEKKVENWECRICGSKEYDVNSSTPYYKSPSGKSSPIDFKCSGCSVVFVDPEKFSKNAKEG